MDYLDPFSFGYGSKIALVALVDDLLPELYKEPMTLVITLDLFMAFDTINHGSLLIVFWDSSLQWFWSYLKGKSKECSAEVLLVCPLAFGLWGLPRFHNIL